jgi:hypothetical protein
MNKADEIVTKLGPDEKASEMTQEGQRLDDSECAGGDGGGQGHYDPETILMPSIVKCGTTTPFSPLKTPFSPLKKLITG